jgi:hypothetical protein
VPRSWASTDAGRLGRSAATPCYRRRGRFASLTNASGADCSRQAALLASLQ